METTMADTVLNELVLNDVTKAQFDAMEKDPNQVYLVADDSGTGGGNEIEWAKFADATKSVTGLIPVYELGALPNGTFGFYVKAMTTPGCYTTVYIKFEKYSSTGVQNGSVTLVLNGVDTQKGPISYGLNLVDSNNSCTIYKDDNDTLYLSTYYVNNPLNALINYSWPDPIKNVFCISKIKNLDTNDTYEPGDIVWFSDYGDGKGAYLSEKGASVIADVTSPNFIELPAQQPDSMKFSSVELSGTGAVCLDMNFVVASSEKSSETGAREYLMCITDVDNTNINCLCMRVSNVSAGVLVEKITATGVFANVDIRCYKNLPNWNPTSVCLMLGDDTLDLSNTPVHGWWSVYGSKTTVNIDADFFQGQDITKGTVVPVIMNQFSTAQLTTMSVNDINAFNVGRVVQYVGETNEQFVTGRFYKATGDVSIGGTKYVAYDIASGGDISITVSNRQNFKDVIAQYLSSTYEGKSQWYVQGTSVFLLDGAYGGWYYMDQTIFDITPADADTYFWVREESSDSVVTNAAWVEIPVASGLPDQTGFSNSVLTTTGSSAYWSSSLILTNVFPKSSASSTIGAANSPFYGVYTTRISKNGTDMITIPAETGTLATKEYVTSVVGDIETALSNI